MPNEYFSVDKYVSPTRFGAARGIVLGIRLIGAAPAEMGPRPRDALEMVRSETVDLQGLLRERLSVTHVDLGELDTILDSCWVGFRMALEARARLLGKPVAKEAAELLVRVLPDETDFVMEAYEVEWNTSNTLLERIANEEGLEDRINEVVGPVFLSAIREAHEAFGDALGLGDDPFESEESIAISGAIRKLAIAIAEYGRMLVGELDRNDPASVAAFRKAVAPIDAHREWLASTRTDATDTPPPPVGGVVVDGDVSSDDPVPPLPAT